DALRDILICGLVFGSRLNHNSLSRRIIRPRFGADSAPPALTSGNFEKVGHSADQLWGRKRRILPFVDVHKIECKVRLVSVVWKVSWVQWRRPGIREQISCASNPCTAGGAESSCAERPGAIHRHVTIRICAGCRAEHARWRRARQGAPTP
ncbi:hypothetical protein H4S02_012777, partial [Coemansia sp. RSA 2611]